MPKINPKKIYDTIKNLKTNLYLKPFQQRDGFFIKDSQISSLIQFLLYGLTNDIIDNKGVVNPKALWQSDKNNEPNIRHFSENNHSYVTCEYNDLSVNDEKDENIAIGSFGPITARFLSTQKYNHEGFQLEYIEAESKFICSLLDGTHKKNAHEIRMASIAELRLHTIKNFITNYKWPDHKIPPYLNKYLAKIKKDNDPSKILNDIKNDLLEIIKTKLHSPLSTQKLFSTNTPFPGTLLDLIKNLEKTASYSYLSNKKTPLELTNGVLLYGAWR